MRRKIIRLVSNTQVCSCKPSGIRRRKQLEILVGQRGRMADYRLTFADLLLRLKEFDAVREQLTELIKDPRFARQGALRLTRAFLAEHRLNEARQVFDAHLQKYSDLTIEDKRVLGRVLIDMERAEEALKLMTPMHNADPDDEVITTLLVSAKVRMNMRIEALAIIEEAAQRSFRDKGLWLELGTELYQEYANPEAALTLRNICRQDPDYRRAKLALRERTCG